jgi:hypothetical protein
VIENETTTTRPWLKPNGGSYTTGAGLAGYLREMADAIEGVGEISSTSVCLGFQASSYETDPAARVVAVDAVASALGMSASLTHMHGSAWHYTTRLGDYAVNVYSRVNGPTCRWVGGYGCQEEQAGNAEGLCAAHLETLRDDIAAAEALLAAGQPTRVKDLVGGDYYTRIEDGRFARETELGLSSVNVFSLDELTARYGRMVDVSPLVEVQPDAEAVQP